MQRVGASGSSIGWLVQPGLIYAGLMLFAVLAGGLLAFSLVMRRARKRSLRAADSRCAGEEVVYRDPAALYIGRESCGDRQLRGNGVFVLTRERVFFTLWLPRREVHIPLERIRGIDTPRQFLGRSVGRRLLQIRYVDAEGRADTAAWFVRGLEDCCGFLQGSTPSASSARE